MQTFLVLRTFKPYGHHPGDTHQIVIAADDATAAIRRFLPDEEHGNIERTSETDATAIIPHGPGSIFYSATPTDEQTSAFLFVEIQGKKIPLGHWYDPGTGAKEA
jgi:hypothetical protein